jgi:hypothetical protein
MCRALVLIPTTSKFKKEKKRTLLFPLNDLDILVKNPLATNA